MRFEVEGPEPIARMEFDMSDPEPAIPILFDVGRGFDGRFVRAFAFKPTTNGTWDLVVRAFVRGGSGGYTLVGSATCPGVNVTF